MGLGGGGLVLILALLLGLRAVGQRLMAENRTKAAQRAATGPAAASAAGPQVYQSPTGRFSVEFPGRPKREFVRSSERGGLAHWEADLMLGQFLQGRGEQFLAVEQPIAKRLAEGKIEAALAQLVNVTAHTDDGAGRILTTQDISQPGYRGREVTYEYTAKSGVRVSGRYRALFTDREIISIEWIAAPAKPETPEVKRYFDSFKMSSVQ
jgi:hypothetical protein